MDNEQYETLREILSAIYIQISRTYDMLAIIGDKLGADVIALSQEHANGRILAPDPWMNDETDYIPDSRPDSDNDIP